MKYTLSFILLFFVAINTFAQTRIFPELDFEKNKYELYIFSGINIFEYDTNYAVTDQAIIKNIAETWTGEKVNYVLMCGYDHEIKIVCNGKIVSTINYNSQCEHGGSSQGRFDIKMNPFKDLNKEDTVIDYTYKSKVAANSKKFLAKSVATEGVFLRHADEYKNLDYIGEFYLYIKEPSGTKITDEGLKQHLAKIKQKYPDDDYNIDIHCYNGSDYETKVASNEAFWLKFDMLDRKYDKWGWGEYDNFDVYVFGRKNIMEQLISENKE